MSIKALASGQLAGSKGTLYTVPGSTQAVVKSITLVNTDSVTRTVNLYVNTAGTSRRICPKDLSLPAGAMFELDRVITLEAADLIEGDASTATVVDFVISGAENA
jgi:hypothetical protein